jgi:hypothetical protein
MRYRGFQSEAPSAASLGEDEREPQIGRLAAQEVVEQRLELGGIRQDVAGGDPDLTPRTGAHHRLERDPDVAPEVTVGVDDLDRRGGEAPVGGGGPGHPDRVEDTGRAQAIDQVLDQAASADADVEALATGEGVQAATLRRQRGRLAIAAAEDDQGMRAASGREPHGCRRLSGEPLLPLRPPLAPRAAVAAELSLLGGEYSAAGAPVGNT